MKQKYDNSGEPEHQKNGEFHTPNALRTVTIIKGFILRTKTWLMRHISLMPGQVFHYFIFFLAWILKLGFRAILINLIIIVFCCYIFWESGKDTLIIEPFEVPEQLTKEGYNGRVIANKLMDQMNYLKEHSEIVSSLTLRFLSRSDGEKKEDERKMLENIYPIVTHSSSQTEQIDIQIPGAGISLNSIIQYIKKCSVVRLGNCVKLVSEKDEKKILF